MKQCAIITAYKNPETLDKILSVLNNNMTVFIHVDEKNELAFSYLRTKYKCVSFFTICKVNWGSYNHFEVIVYLLKKSLTEEWDYVHLISGEDFPLISPVEMQERLNKTNKIFINPVCISNKKSKFYKRYAFKWPYVYFDNNYKNSYTRILNIGFVFFQKSLNMKKNGIGNFDNIFHSFLWGTYPRDVMEYVIDFLEKNENYKKDLRWCKIPEELAFCTIIMNSKYKDRVAYDSLRLFYMKRKDWGPRYLENEDINGFEGSTAFFCRKVSVKNDVIEYLIKRTNVKN